MTSDRVTVKAVITRKNGPHYMNEDVVDMEVHDLVDYLVLKYITRGNRLQALPARLTTELSREGARIEREKVL